MLLYILLKRIYFDNKLKPPKEARDALLKLYSSFKEPPERGKKYNGKIFIEQSNFLL